MKRLGVLLVVVVAGVIAAAFAVPANAVTVNGTAVTQASLNADLAAIAHSPAYQCYLNASQAVASNGTSPLPGVAGAGLGAAGSASAAPSGTGVNGIPAGGGGTYNTAFVDSWLSQRVDEILIAQELAARKLVVTSSELTAARSELSSSISSILADVSGSQFACPESASTVLSSMPASFVNAQVLAQAQKDVLLAADAGYGLSTSDLESYYNAHRSSFDKLCLSLIVTQTQATANSLRSQVAKGASFAQLARTQSIDSTTAANGGVLGCVVVSQFTFASQVDKLSVGQVSAPISYQGAYLLLQVTSRTTSPFTSVVSAVRQAVQGAGVSTATAALQKDQARAAIRVDARYGTWHAVASTAGVFPPATPPAAQVLAPAANLPPGTSGGPAPAGG